MFGHLGESVARPSLDLERLRVCAERPWFSEKVTPSIRSPWVRCRTVDCNHARGRGEGRISTVSVNGPNHPPPLHALATLSTETWLLFWNSGIKNLEFGRPCHCPGTMSTHNSFPPLNHLLRCANLIRTISKMIQRRTTILSSKYHRKNLNLCEGAHNPSGKSNRSLGE